MATEYAIIDIGSNSVRYAEESGGGLPDKEVYTTRLGAGLSATGMLSCASMEKSIGVMRKLADRARAGGFVPRGYATSAVRDAGNGREFAARVEKECGFPVEILSGEEEARLAFLGASRGEEGAAMLDIGGASMQIVTKDFGVSFRAGCVRCGDIARAAAGVNDCDTDFEKQRLAVREYMDGAVDMPNVPADRLVGVGGTITTLAALKAGLTEFDSAEVERTVLTRADVAGLIKELAEAGEKRRENPLLKERHDVILYGACILEKALEMLGKDRLSVSCRDGLEGYLHKVKNERN